MSMRLSSRALIATTSFSVVLAMTAVPATAVGHAAAPATATAATTRTGANSFKEGVKDTISGKVPAQFGNHLVVLEIVDGKTRQEMGMAVADKQGNVTMKVNFGGNGVHKAQWRVIKNGKAQWTSKAFTITVSDSGKKHVALADAYDVFSHNFPASSAAPNNGQKKPGKSARSKQYRDAEGATNEAGPVVDSAAENATESTEKSAGQVLGDFGTSLATNVGWDFVADGVTSLFGVIFSGQAPATAGQVSQLTADVQQGFATVEAQMSSVEAGLTSLSQQVATTQSEVVNANASAATANCNTVLNEANSYVQRIQNAFGNYQTTLDPQWIQANLLNQSSTQGLNVLGETIYGQNAGTPAFASGVTSLQNSVTDLGALLTANGPAATGLIPSCGSAVSAGVAATFAATQQSAGLAENQSMIAAGAVEQAYYNNMHPMVAFYTGWMALGQVLAARGGQMGAALLAGNTVQSAAALDGLCVGTAGSQAASDVSCPGIVFNVQNTINQINGAWTTTGASWFDVSNGKLVGDARAGASSDYMTPAQHVWVQDIAQYGSGVPGIQSTGYTATAPLSSLAEASNTPASGVNALRQSTWNGLNFTGANTAAWEYLLPTQNCSSTANCIGWNNTGALMNQAGLMNYGSTPNNLIVYTGEWGLFYTGTSTDGWMTTEPSVSYNSSIKNTGMQPFTNYQMTALSFLDTNTLPELGSNPVIQPPKTAQGEWMSAYVPMNYGQFVGGGPDEVCQVNPLTNACQGTVGPYNAMLQTGAPVSGDPNQSTGVPNATLNGTFYGPLIEQEQFDINYNPNGNTPSASYSNQSDSILYVPSFMGYPGAAGPANPQQQYLWPVLNLPLPNSTAVAAPCAMTSFSQGFDGQAGVGNVCQGMYDKWLAGALGIGTGPVSITGGGIQGTLTPAGNNTLNALIVNNGSNAQQVTVYAGVSTGDAQIGSVINAGSSAGDDANGVTLGNCSTSTVKSSTVLQCSLTVQPGTTVINMPVTGKGGATSYANANVVLALAGSGSTSSSTTQITPTMPASSLVVPPAVGDFAAGTDPMSTTSSLYAALTWTVPTATPGITGYQFSITDPSGNETTQTATQGSSNVVVENGYTAGASASVDLPLPSTQSGAWTIEVTPVNAAGNGPSSTATAALGNSAPATPTGFTATETGLGPIRLAWKPVSANPPLSNYSITITPPSNGTTTAAPITVVTNVPQYLFANVTSTGTWTFSLTATNSVGTSKPATTTVNVNGTIPTKPLNLDADVDAGGWVSLSFNSAVSVPSADNYWVGLYAPGQTTATASLQVPVTSHDEKVRVRNFFQLGSNSPTGTWSVVVSASNGIGVGDFAQSALYVSSGLIAAVGNNLALQQYLDSVPALVLQSASASCAAWNWHPGLNVFGTCVDGVFTAAQTTSTWNSIGSPVGTTSAITDGTTTPTPGPSSSTSGTGT